jgi:hypothetical protein
MNPPDDGPKLVGFSVGPAKPLIALQKLLRGPHHKPNATKPGVARRAVSPGARAMTRLDARSTLATASSSTCHVKRSVRRSAAQELERVTDGVKACSTTRVVSAGMKWIGNR